METIERRGSIEQLTNCPSCGARIEVVLRTLVESGKPSKTGCVCPNCERLFVLTR